MNIEERIGEIPELSFIWHHAPGGMAFVDSDGHLLAVNDALGRFLGYTATELRGMHFKDVTSGADRMVDLEAFESVVNGTRDSYTMHKLYKPKMGQPRPAKLIVKRSPWSDTRGAIMFSTVLPIDAFEAAGVDPEERRAVLQQAIGEMILKNWRIWLPILLALAGIANLGRLIDAFSG